MEQHCGVNVLSLPTGSQMEVRPGHAAGGAAKTETLALGDVFSGLHLDPGQVHVKRAELLAVIDHHQIAFIDHTLSDNHHSVVGGDHGRSRRSVKVGSTMDAGQLAVEHAAGAEGISGGKRHW